MHPKTLIAVFSLNERENIAELAGTISGLGLDADILVIDDDSLDGTQAVLPELAAKHRSLSYIVRKGARGRGFSEIDAINYAATRGYEYLLEMDADFSHDPADIVKLLETAPYYDMVIGSRYIGGGQETGRSLARRLLSRAANRYIRSMLDLKSVHDCTSGFRCYNKEAVRTLSSRQLKSRGPSVLVEMLLVLRDRRIAEVPVIYRGRKKGKSKFSLGLLLESVRTVIRLKRRGVPESI
ncbi:MAG: glycosyltransferase [Elusimicrobia bacterium]|nr:glycosyltransferase [Elusimicrobiota bacterium]